MNCKDIELLLSAYADDELAQTQREFVETHLKTCVECQVRLAEQQRISKRLAALRDLPAVPDIKAKTMARIKGDVEPKKSRRIWRPAFVAVPLTLVLVFALIWNLPGGSKMITAEELVAALIENSSNITSFQVDGTSQLKITFPNQGAPTVLNITSTTSTDLDAQRSHTDQTLTRSTGSPERTEKYFFDGWMYRLYHTVGIGQGLNVQTGVWYKFEMTAELWAVQFHTLHDNRESLISWLFFDPKVTILGTEKINGIDCYKVMIEADLAAASAAYFPDEPTTITEFHLTGWVDKESLNLVKSDLSYRSIASQGILSEVSAINYYSKLNEVSIVPPPEVFNAKPG